jgi:hypothetical protein
VLADTLQSQKWNITFRSIITPALIAVTLAGGASAAPATGVNTGTAPCDTGPVGTELMEIRSPGRPKNLEKRKAILNAAETRFWQRGFGSAVLCRRAGCVTCWPISCPKRPRGVRLLQMICVPPLQTCQACGWVFARSSATWSWERR